jgi:serine/threonine protein kinase
LHACGIVHGDIKPQNVLLFRHVSKDGFIAKLSDFGGCYVPLFKDENKADEKVNTPSMMGTAYWNAPEWIDSRTSNKIRLGHEDLSARDHFCFGLLVYYVMFDKPPFGKEELVDEARLREISELKCQNAVIKMVQEEMACWWKLGCELDALQELSNETNFQKRHTIFQRHYQKGRVSCNFYAQ